MDTTIHSSTEFSVKHKRPKLVMLNGRTDDNQAHSWHQLPNVNPTLRYHRPEENYNNTENMETRTTQTDPARAQVLTPPIPIIGIHDKRRRTFHITILTITR